MVDVLYISVNKKKRLISSVLVSLLFLFSISGFTQITTNHKGLRRFVSERQAIENIRKSNLNKVATLKGYVIRRDNGSVTIELQYIDERGFPQYYVTDNANSAKTISTNRVYSGGGAGLSLDGSGVKVREWDAGGVRTSHQEFGGRVDYDDGGYGYHYHSTHVAGTIIGSGIVAAAKGMAPAASLRAFDWNYDDAEMASEAADGTLVSNHSYGYLRGWSGSTWWGDTTISNNEDYKFGFYDETSQSWDEIAYNAPYYLIVKSSGNDRDDDGTGHDPDGPYDCIDQLGIAKNILTVGAVNDISSGYSQPSDVVMTSFSSWGPADDGRIKPDIVANGSGLYSAYSTGDANYNYLTGTSMAAPSVTGSIALLIQQYENVFGSESKMRAATMKALIINTADEAGSTDGPDYSFGWGLMNTEKAALKIAEDDTTDVIYEGVLEEGDSVVRFITLFDTSLLRVTLVWTDPPGSIPDAAVDPSDTNLVNDLNLTIFDTNISTVYYPWKLDKNSPSNAATKGVNAIDNVEQVDIASPDSGHVYKIVVNYAGTLTNGRQAFSLVISGDVKNGDQPAADFYASGLSPRINQKIEFYDASFNNPTSRRWSFSPDTITYLDGTDSSSMNPHVKFLASGSYSVSLFVQNAYGDSIELKSDYITVGADPGGYCEAYSHDSWGYISRVQFCEIDNDSDSTNVGDVDPNDKYYEDWTSIPSRVVVGQKRELVITNSVVDSVYTPYMDVFVWVDWNRDGDFWDEGENVVESINNGGGGTFEIEIPVDASLGNTRMRIRTHYYDEFGTYPCGNTDFGEVEDYTLEIIDSSPVIWTGSVDSLWSNTANWSSGSVPDFASDVIISTTATRFPFVPISDTVECNSLILESTTRLTVIGAVEIYGW